MNSGPKPRVVILIPVFNDWDCIRLLLPLLDQAVVRTNAEIRVLLVDDGSTRKLPTDLVRPAGCIRQVHVLHLTRNLGHQRAIAIGLYHIHQHTPCDKVIVMDADGQDLPEQLCALLDASERQPDRVVFAARTKRMESLTFRLFYWLYRLSHRLLTGIPVRIGNFSVLPWDAVGRLLVVSDLWSHYAAAVVRARLAYSMIPLPRGNRLMGRSRMNFAGLVIHGLSAICVFGDLASARLLAGAVGFALLTGAAGCTGLVLHAAAKWSPPLWSIYLWAALLLFSVQAVMMAAALTFIVIAGRSHTSFIPLRDGRYFVRGLTELAAEFQVSAEAPARTMVP